MEYYHALCLTYAACRKHFKTSLSHYFKLNVVQSYNLGKYGMPV